MTGRMLATFVVDGQATPQGSLTPFIHHATGKVVAPQKQAVRIWRDTVATAARHAYTGDPTDAAVQVRLTFELARPRSHYGTGRNTGQLKASAPLRCVTRPDLDKLTRAIFDACTGVIWCDDSQVIDLTASKSWTDEPYTTIEVLTVGAATERVPDWELTEEWEARNRHPDRRRRPGGPLDQWDPTLGVDHGDHS